jgi:hypothetical protein
VFEQAIDGIGDFELAASTGAECANDLENLRTEGVHPDHSEVGTRDLGLLYDMFQALGHTLPALVASLARIVLVAIPAFILSRMPGFQLHWIWYLSVFALLVQLAVTLVLLQREMGRRLAFTPPERLAT